MWWWVADGPVAGGRRGAQSLGDADAAADLLPGEYRLVTGFYTWPDLVRVPLTDGSGDRVELTTLTAR